MVDENDLQQELQQEQDAASLNPDNEDKGFLKRMWGNMQPPARYGIIAIFGLALAALLYLSVSMNFTPEKEILFNRLDPAQAREITAALDEKDVLYELADDGTTILVPPEQRDRLRISLSPDLYAQGIGFDLFEEGALVASDFERRAQWQIALEEELRRTITSLDAVEQARVHLVITEEGLFIRERQEPSASVFLRLNPLTSIDEGQVRGILGLVAGSVEGLNPENVNIVDSKGNVLYDAFADLNDVPRTNAVEEHYYLQRQFEIELERRLRSILEQVYGQGKAVAMVSADMDFDFHEQTSVAYQNEPVPRSTHLVEEYSENIAPPAEEVGEPNVPGQAAVLGEGGDSMHEYREEIVNYEVGETRDYIETAPGRINNLSTAVIIDADGNDPFMAEQVTELVNSAIGINEARGDMVSVQMIPFDAEAIIDPEPALPLEEAPFPLLWAIIGAVVVLLLLLILFFVMRARARRRREEEEDEMDPLSLENQMKSRVQQDEYETEASEAERKAKNIRDMAKEEPESVANLLKTWLAEE